MNSLMVLLLSILLIPLSAKAISVDLGLGYSMLELSNPDSSTARSNGLGVSIGAYYSLFGNENFDFGLKGSAFYSKLDNDINTPVLSEETKYYNAGLGLELAVYDFFASWQHKYNRIKIELSGNMNNTSDFSDYMSQIELGYIFHMEAMSVRLVYQRTDGTLPAIDTHLSSDTDFTSNSFMVVLRFDLSPKPKTPENNYRYKPFSEESSSLTRDTSKENSEDASAVPSYRSYRYAPRPSPRIK